MNDLKKAEFLARLAKFLEVHNNTKIPQGDPGLLKMQIAHARNNKKTKKKDVIINFLLMKLQEILMEEKEKSDRQSVLSDFLVNELEDFYRNSLK